MMILQKKRLIFNILVLFTFMFGWVSIACSAVDTMPPFSLPSAVDGKFVSSDGFTGKVLLVTFFATWCPPCRKEVPVLKDLHEKYSEKGFSVVALSVDEKGPSVVVDMINKERINYPVLMSKRSVERDFGGIIGIPTSFLVNKSGKVVKMYPGYIPEVLLERDIKSVL